MSYAQERPTYYQDTLTEQRIQLEASFLEVASRSIGAALTRTVVRTDAAGFEYDYVETYYPTYA